MSEKDNNLALDQYESLLKELEDSLKIVEDKNSSLQDVIRAYDAGIQAHKQCVDLLNNMEQKVIEIAKNK